MKKWLVVIVFLFFSANQSFSQARSKGAEGQTTNSGFNQVRVLSIGVSDYQNLENDLNYAHSDAAHFLELVKGVFNLDSSEYLLLQNDKATAGNIYGGLDWLLEKQSSEDLSIVYFSGHGDVETKTLRQRGFLLAYDSPAAGYHAGGTIRVNDVQDYLETMLESGSKVLLIVDACRSGNLAGGDDGRKNTANSLVQQWSNIAKILSAQPGEVSFEDAAWGGGYGVFTFYLLKGLNGEADNAPQDGMLRLAEMDIYLKSKVSADTDYEQNPMVVGDAKSLLFMSNVEQPELMASAKTTKGNKKGKSASGKKSDTENDAATLNKYLNQFNMAVGREDWRKSRRTSAYALYKRVETEFPDDQNIRLYMKNTLTAGLCNRAQSTINVYMKGENRGYEKNIYKGAAADLKMALEIMGENNIRYDDYYSRYLFLDAYSTYLSGESSKWKAAAFKLDKSLEIDPEASYTYHVLGQLYSRYGGSEESLTALSYFNEALDFSPMWSYPYLSIGEYYLFKDELDSALKYYDKGIEINPDVITAYNNRGIVYLKKGASREAFDDFTMAASKDSMYVDPVYNLGSILILSGDVENGIKLLEEALSIDSEHFPTKELLSATYGSLAETYAQEGKYNEAALLSSRQISLFPGDPKLKVSTGKYFLSAKDYQKAGPLFASAIEMDRENGSYFYLLARALAGSGDKSNMIRSLEMAYKLGYKDYELSEVEFESYREDAEVKSIVGRYK